MEQWCGLAQKYHVSDCLSIQAWCIVLYIPTCQHSVQMLSFNLNVSPFFVCLDYAMPTVHRMCNWSLYEMYVFSFVFWYISLQLLRFPHQKNTFTQKYNEFRSISCQAALLSCCLSATTWMCCGQTSGWMYRLQALYLDQTCFWTVLGCVSMSGSALTNFFRIGILSMMMHCISKHSSLWFQLVNCLTMWTVTILLFVFWNQWVTGGCFMTCSILLYSILHIAGPCLYAVLCSHSFCIWRSIAKHINIGMVFGYSKQLLLQSIRKNLPGVSSHLICTVRTSAFIRDW